MANVEHLDERVLLRRAQEGDSEAREIIYEKYLQKNAALGRFLRRELTGSFLHQDLLHEIYLRLVHQHSDFLGKSKLETYIFQIARRTILEKRRRSSALKRGGSVRIVLPDDSILENLPDTRYHAEVELGWVMQKLLGEIPDVYREAVRLRLLEERDYKEISEILDLNINTVSTRIHKGKKILIALLEKYGIWGRF